MSTPNVIDYNNLDSRYATSTQLSSKANASTASIGTISSSTVLPALSYSVATLTTTSATSASITLPSAVAGQSFDLYIINPSSGTVNTPTIGPASGQTLVWTSPISWLNSLGATNIIGLECAVNGVWQAYPLTSGLGSAAPLQEQMLHVTSAGATQTVISPLASPFYTVDHYILSANLTLTMPPISSNGGESFSLWIDQPSGGSYSIAFSGTLRWVGGTAAVAPGSAQRLWCTFLADNSTNQWLGMIVSTGF